MCRGPEVGREHSSARGKLQEGQRESGLVSQGGRAALDWGQAKQNPLS